MMEEVDDAELVVERIAALDLGKAGLEACVRVPSPHRPGRRMQELRGYGTTTAQLLQMVAWLRHWGVQRAVMELMAHFRAQLGPAGYDGTVAAAHGHGAIVDAIVEGDPVRARHAAVSHLHYVAALLRDADAER